MKKKYILVVIRIEITRASHENNGKPLRTRWERVISQKKTIENLLFDYDTYYFRNFIPPLQVDKKMIYKLKDDQNNENQKKLYKLQKVFYN